MKIFFIKNIPVGTKITEIGKVIENHNKSMVAIAEIKTEDKQLLVKGRGTFYICNNLRDKG